MNVLLVAAALMSTVSARPICNAEGISVFKWTIAEMAKKENLTVPEACAKVKALGVDGFDCQYDDAELETYTATVLKPINLFGRVKFRTPDKGERQGRAFVAAAVHHHVPRIMVIPDDFTDGQPDETEFREIVKGMRLLVAIAAKENVAVMVETFGGKKNACSYAYFVQRLLREVPGLRFALDTGNLHFAGRGDDIVGVAHCASNRIEHIHLKDWKKGVPPISADGTRNSTTLGLGTVPNRELVRYARSIGFRGWYTLEEVLKNDMLADIARQVAVLRLWLEK